MPDEPRSKNPQVPNEGNFAAALSELLACETLAQICGWTARWIQAIAGADAALVWTPDPSQPLFTCTGASGEGIGRVLRRSVPRGDGFVRRLIRDQEPFALTTAELLVTEDPWLSPLAQNFGACLAIPLRAEGGVIGAVAVLFRRPDADTAVALNALGTFIPDAAAAVARGLRQDKKTAGMLHGIERLTNLYDLSKAFGSTIDWGELTAIIAQKAVDFANGEAASLWILEGDEGEVSLAATAVSENYEIENAPSAVGGSVTADLIASRGELIDNDLAEDHALRTENAPYEVRSVLAVALVEDDAPVGALVVVNKRGRHPQFSEIDRDLLVDLGHQAVRALRNARRYEAEKKVEELDALLAVSREITATLDLDRVMNTVVNSASALIQYDRCAIAIFQKGKLRLGAVSGVATIERTDPSIRRSEEILEWVYLAGSDVDVLQDDEGEVTTQRPESIEKFRTFFQQSEMRSFHGVMLKDEEGNLGVLGFESREPIYFDQNTEDLLRILVNQATVALRNAQLYQQVPLAGFWKPLLEKKRQLAEMPKGRQRGWAIGAVVALLAFILVPWNIRVTGNARITPEHRVSVTPAIDGVIESVRHREGDRVEAGEVIATLRDEAYRTDLAEAKASLSIAESEFSRQSNLGESALSFQAAARRDELRAKAAVAQTMLDRTAIRAPETGTIVTPRLEEKAGQFMTRGDEFCVLANADHVSAEVAVPEKEVQRIHTGQKVDLKLNSYPTRIFSGTVTRLGAEVHQEGDDRFLLAECDVNGPGGLLRPGMLGRGKISTGRQRLGYAIFRKPARYFWTKLWPLLP
jgi:RND family efflux transporter MFP subunit